MTIILLKLKYYVINSDVGISFIFNLLIFNSYGFINAMIISYNTIFF